MNIYRFKVLGGERILLATEVNMPNSNSACVGTKETSVLQGEQPIKMDEVSCICIRTELRLKQKI